jgi:hypothetical protein
VERMPRYYTTLIAERMPRHIADLPSRHHGRIEANADTKLSSALNPEPFRVEKAFTGILSSCNGAELAMVAGQQIFE